MSDAGDDGAFLRRWSRRKRTGGADRRTAGEPAPAERASEPSPRTLSEAERERLIAELPDVESLDRTSDFTAFLREGVPEELKRRALRRLWRLDPVFANLDGLNDYDLDYSNAATVVEHLKTAWQVGKGYADEPAGGDAADTATPVAAAPDETAQSPHGPAEDGAGSPQAVVHGDAERQGAGPRGSGRPEPTTETGRAEETAVADTGEAAASGPSRRPATAARRRWGA